MDVTESKFKVGDRVRVLRTDYPQIPVGTVTHIVFADGEDADLWCADFPEGLRFWGHEFELAPKFAVGDRARLIKDGRSTTGAVGKLATIDSWGGDIVQRGEYLLNIDAPHDYKTLSVDPQYTRATPDCFDLVQPLTIQAGRFYKTRDGRKALVGDNDGNPTFPFYHEVDGVLWHGLTSEGKSCLAEADNDLIAEWPADDCCGNYTSCAAAEVDNMRDEYGPFGEPEETTMASIVARLEKLEAASTLRPAIGTRVTLRATVTGNATKNSINVVLDDVSGNGRSVVVPVRAVQEAT